MPIAVIFVKEVVRRQQSSYRVGAYNPPVFLLREIFQSDKQKVSTQSFTRLKERAASIAAFSISQQPHLLRLGSAFLISLCDAYVAHILPVLPK